ncbi:phosphate acyltransferase [Aerococcus urinaehominis]|uniref:Phosphate acyltransferase n=1 Tax=Aerococcus urinaehominis TaxID=128944 RepID=A0A109RHQ4_9LACT|nr:phosphate acyltransferase PlsX [Aerococcus urinaehominis]AMB98965.1 phosphate acyltransferase [Aerococcus urinaehominis]SDM37072.1 phosphate:acyl-[acyl carrier protein] acyltransferase [Aerococcus urinaehominis]
MRIAIDAMGGDNAPEEICLGAVKAAQDYPNLSLILYGQADQIKPYLAGQDLANLSVVDCQEVIATGDEPVRAIRKKKDASLVRAARDVKQGHAQALISAGNTGALLAAGLLIVGRMKGVDRPGLMASLPSIQDLDKNWLLIDAGANADSKAQHLHQYAIMATIYADQVLGLSQARVGLLNNGAEASKGSKLTQAAHQLLAQEDQINFIGNVEARDLLNGVADIVVADGFTGNAVLKTIEGTAGSVMKLLKSTIMNSGLSAKMAGAMLKKPLKEMLQHVDHDQAGGAILFGCQAPVIKCHGTANRQTIYQALLQTQDMLAKDISQSMALALAASLQAAKEEE